MIAGARRITAEWEAYIKTGWQLSLGSTIKTIGCAVPVFVPSYPRQATSPTRSNMWPLKGDLHAKLIDWFLSA